MAKEHEMTATAPMETYDLLPIKERLVIDDFHRDVWCLLGLPIDASTTSQMINQIYLRIVDPLGQTPFGCFLTTPNLNFVIAALEDPVFRESVINSDYVVADGMPLVWIGRALNIPICERIAGSSLIEKFRFNRQPDRRPLRIYFFGGPEGVAELACKQLNHEKLGLVGAGYCSPGFGSLASMSTDTIIDDINACQPDIVLVALGAKRGQAWIEHNRSKLTAPAISHLGAVVNFIAGTVERAPLWMQRSGLEWVWRMYQERSLVQRYWRDGTRFLWLYATRVRRYQKYLRNSHHYENTDVPPHIESCDQQEGTLKISLHGALIYTQLDEVRSAFCRAALADSDIELDLGDSCNIDPAFIGLLLILRKHQNLNGKRLQIMGVEGWRKEVFYYNCAEYLIEEEASPHP